MTGASGAQHPETTFRPASPQDVATISRLAREIWTAAYSEMISSAQMEYMLEWMYSPETLHREITEEGVSYFLIELDRDTVGYLAFSHENSTAHLHKLYLKPEWHGKRLGSAALAWLAEICAAAGAKAIELRVNKTNASAIRAYRRNGFCHTDSDCKDIGGGFVMDDYIFVRTLPKRNH